MLPGSDGAKVNFLLVELGSGSWESWIWLTLPETLAITVVEGDITYRGPTVLNEYGGLELRHGFMVFVLLYKVTEKTLSTCVFCPSQRYPGCGGRV